MKRLAAPERGFRVSLASDVADVIRMHLLRFILSTRWQSGLRLACLPGDLVSNYIVATGLYERRLLLAFQHLFQEYAEVFRNTCALDVGANIGNHTCFLARHFAEVIAFEPNPPAFHILQANLYLNELCNVVAVPVGLGARAGSLRFLEDASGNLGGSGFRREASGEHIARELPIVRGDDYFAENPFRGELSLVKIDVEGFESDVIRGLEATLKKHRPIVIFEDLAVEPGGSPREILTEFGYDRFFTIKKRPSPFPGGIRRALHRCLDNRVYLQPLDAAHNHYMAVALP